MTAARREPRIRGLIFTDTVPALLDGTKTQTRRPVKGAPTDAIEAVPSLLAHRGDLWDFRRHLDNPVAIRCPLVVGDRFYVKERWDYVPDIRDPLVRADQLARAEVGLARYGVKLQAHNGRDALRDAYEEALDAIMYTRQAVEEERDAVERCVLFEVYASAITLAARPRTAIERRDSWRRLAP